MWCQNESSDRMKCSKLSPRCVLNNIIMTTCDTMTVDLPLFNDSTDVENVMYFMYRYFKAKYDVALYDSASCKNQIRTQRLFYLFF